MLGMRAYATINAHIIHTCAAAPSYNSSSYMYLAMDMVTDSITDSMAQDDTLKKPPQPVKHNLTHVPLGKRKQWPVPSNQWQWLHYTHKAQDVI